MDHLLKAYDAAHPLARARGNAKASRPAPEEARKKDA
jgi:hypothetical protein